MHSVYDYYVHESKKLFSVYSVDNQTSVEENKILNNILSKLIGKTFVTERQKHSLGTEFLKRSVQEQNGEKSSWFMSIAISTILPSTLLLVIVQSTAHSFLMKLFCVLIYVVFVVQLFNSFVFNKKLHFLTNTSKFQNQYGQQQVTKNIFNNFTQYLDGILDKKLERLYQN